VEQLTLIPLSSTVGRVAFTVIRCSPLSPASIELSSRYTTADIVLALDKWKQ